jgi:hypothetical protein
MKISKDLVLEVAQAIRLSQAVPLPGGHGVWFSDFRARHPALSSTPIVEARCYVCLALLGDGEGEQRWNPKEWWPHAMAWFDIYCPELAVRLDAPRWAYLLAAMLSVVQSGLKRQSHFRHLSAFANDCYGRAQERLRQMTRDSKAKSGLSALPEKPVGFKIEKADKWWGAALEELDGPFGQRTEMSFFMFILHSSLGIGQHSMEERYSTRLPFYGQLKAILQEGTLLADVMSGQAQRVSDQMATTALLGKASKPMEANPEPPKKLPACFQLANYLSRCPPRALIEIRLETVPDQRDRLLLTYDLALAAADMIMDIFRSGAIEGPAFRPSAYDYLHSLIRYGPKMYDEEARRGTLPSDDPELQDWPAPSAVPMTRSFAERMRSGLLVGPARTRLNEDVNQARPAP